MRVRGKPVGEGASPGAHACLAGRREGLGRMRGGWWREVVSGAVSGGGGFAVSVAGARLLRRLVRGPSAPCWVGEERRVWLVVFFFSAGGFVSGAALEFGLGGPVELLSEPWPKLSGAVET